MAQVLISEQYLNNIADAIRGKNGSSEMYTPAQMAGAVNALYPEPSGTLDITQNGTVDVKSKASANVNVPNTYSASDEGKVVVNQALTSQTSKNINANGTHDTTANNSVVVDVPNSYAAADDGKVVSSGELVAQTSRNVTENGTYDTTENNEVVVNVQGGGGGGSTLIAKSITQNGTYNASDDSADGYSQVTVNVSGGSSLALIDYDFTKLSGTSRGVTYNSNGATFPNSPGSKAYIPILAYPDITIYIDVGNMNFPDTNYHRRFIMRDYSDGFIYRTTGKWAFYSGSWEESDITDNSYFSNSKVKVYIDSSQKWHIYKNNILVFEPTNALAINDLMIGSSEQYSIIGAVITGARVYQGDYTET